jgi:PhzF family phenazine biosynthesis protein
MPQQVPLYQVDAFTDTPFRGNPAAVCVLDKAADVGWMQSVAAEMNLSETAFVCPEGDGYGLRWFTPAAEVSLCGHATLASAHVLWATGRMEQDRRIEFKTLSGLLTVERYEAHMEMDFPADAARPSEVPGGLFEALGISQALEVLRGKTDLIIRLASAGELRDLRPDFRLLGGVPGIRGVIVTAASDSGDYDFMSRFFAPAVGVDEDPVTGSAHCLSGPYWSAELGREELRAYQASTRGGALHLRVCGERIRIGGQAVTVSEGVLHV